MFLHVCAVYSDIQIGFLCFCCEMYVKDESERMTVKIHTEFVYRKEG